MNAVSKLARAVTSRASEDASTADVAAVEPATTRPTAAPDRVRPALELRDLTTVFPGDAEPTVVVDHVSLAVRPGRTLAVVGESGSGKSMTFLSALGLVPPGGKVSAGESWIDGADIQRLRREEVRRLRGASISMVFQDPLTALNPVFTIGQQIVEVLRAHLSIGRREARARAVDLLRKVQIPDPERRIDDYPHQLSGGMRQRVLIAMAVALDPKVLIADEPTTALDVTVQAQILDLLASLREELGMALVLITHDLGLVAEYADTVAVMYGGRVVEAGTIEEVFSAPLHPYTRALFRSIPRLDEAVTEQLPAIEGQPPNVAKLPPGCAFEPRCDLGRGRADCCTVRPPLVPGDRPGHRSACLHADELVHAEVRP
ncbi:ABC transporter ATP-binding protein [Rhodobium gokarnense]|uniref:Oligopeptide transport system ATP-binding protein n=1 Tax=Rhodobium gokarnense TaxID=364296 RepID=A0ABT3H660_9HYPH|nr:ABC transporter ATP-binding protein [Rhodobium gokarnense]MCW2305878.1 oligopeptide transport system ATP-binding protein [Rhodobium gokarnense]